MCLPTHASMICLLWSFAFTAMAMEHTSARARSQIPVVLSRISINPGVGTQRRPKNSATRAWRKKFLLEELICPNVQDRKINTLCFSVHYFSDPAQGEVKRASPNLGTSQCWTDGWFWVFLCHIKRYNACAPFRYPEAVKWTIELRTATRTAHTKRKRKRRFSQTTTASLEKR